MSRTGCGDLQVGRRADCPTFGAKKKPGRGAVASARFLKSNLFPIATVESLREQRESGRARHWHRW